MTEYYVDFDAAGDSNDGSTWALAKKTLTVGIGLMAAGDTLFVQGAATQTIAAPVTFDCTAGTLKFPLIIRGCIDNISTEPPVFGELAERGTDTLPKFSCRGGGGSDDINFNGKSDWFGMEIDSTGKIKAAATKADLVQFTGCKLSIDGFLDAVFGGVIRTKDCEIRFLTTGSRLAGGPGADERQGTGLYIDGGEFTFAATPTVLITKFFGGFIELTGVDLTGMGNTVVREYVSGVGCTGRSVLRNCSMPGTFTHFSGTPTTPHPIFLKHEEISSTGETGVSNTSSIADYHCTTFWGTVESEFTKVRTNGADDGAKGSFSYKMTPFSSKVLEGTLANLTSPWLRVWTEGGASKTFTVHIANDGAGDFNEDEIWAEFLTVDAGDTAQHDFAVVGEANLYAHLLPSSTAVTDDAGSSWGGSVVNHQKFAITVTPGFEGWVYAQLHYAKRTFDVMYVDPKIVVT